MYSYKISLSCVCGVVGGGSAGCVLASRLTEDKNTRVLVLEAGDEETGNPNIEVPLAATSLRSGALDWGYQTEPQTHACQAMNNRVCGYVHYCSSHI